MQNSYSTLPKPVQRHSFQSRAVSWRTDIDSVRLADTFSHTNGIETHKVAHINNFIMSVIYHREFLPCLICKQLQLITARQGGNKRQLHHRAGWLVFQPHKPPTDFPIPLFPEDFISIRLSQVGIPRRTGEVPSPRAECSLAVAGEAPTAASYLHDAASHVAVRKGIHCATRPAATAAAGEQTLPPPRGQPQLRRPSFSPIAGYSAFIYGG